MYFCTMKLKTLRLLTFSAAFGSTLREDVDYGLNSGLSSIFDYDFTVSLASVCGSSFTISFSGESYGYLYGD